MAKELIKLKKTGIDGLILDVRSNGGGALEEAIRLAGEFIDFGALCITHYRGKEPKIIKDMARGTIYDGPLVLITNSSTASASELLAGALQDYNRALIVGTKTFGKGTIQEVVPVNAGDFDSLVHYKGEPPGYIKLTTGSFYRVTGVSNQKVGVVPDVELPELFDYGFEREASYDWALEFAKINKKTYFNPLDSFPAGRLRKLCDDRIRNNAKFGYLKRKGSVVVKINSQYPIPLSFRKFFDYARRLDEMEDSVAVQKCAFTAEVPEYVKAAGSPTDKNKADNEITLRDIKSDLYINETVNIMNDLIRILKSKAGK
jgi:carboxyl-terminal processing protease